MGVYLKQEEYVKAICLWQIAAELKEEILVSFSRHIFEILSDFLL